MKKTIKQILAGILSIIFLLTMIPFNTFAAPAADIPSDMLDNVYLDALAYTGYSVSTQKDNGTIFKTYGSSTPSSILSDIGYGTDATGLETVTNSETVTGKAPNISQFDSSGLCCASYVTYVYYNYMTNVAGIDTSVCPAPSNTKSAQAYNDAAVAWINAGRAREIAFTQNSNGSNFASTEEIPLGSLVVFEQISTGRINHVAIYAGRYNGQDFVTHVGNSRGPEISTIVGMSKGDTPQRVIRIVIPEFIEPNGRIEVYKEDTDGNKLSGACFVATSLSDSSVKFEIGPTDDNGYAFADGVPFDTYSVRETVFPTNYTSSGVTEWFVTINSQTPNSTAVITAVNELITGSCKVIKTSEDGKIDGIRFKLSGTSLIGNKVELFALTDENGIVMFENVPISGNEPYVIEEVETAIKYVVPLKQNAVIEWNNVNEYNFSNVLKKWRTEVKKADIELYSINNIADGKSQGDATLEGSVYGVYNSNGLVKKYTTDKNGCFTTDYFLCGEDWYIKEISPSAGYMLDDTVYYIDASAEDFSIELNSLKTVCFEQVKKGSILIAKHCDIANSNTALDTPEQGAEFEVYLKSSGSFAEAEETERDFLITDKYGFATTKKLPYGTYTVKQVKGAEGTEIMKPFDVQITEEGEVYKVMINNALFEALVEIVKTDAETGKTIPAANIGFKIKDLKTDEFIVQHINYPTPKDLDVFYTDENGMLMLPEKLPIGEYEIIEQCAPNGYVLDKVPVKFTVDGDKSIVSVTMNNIAQKGIIKVSKTGEIFTSVSQYNGQYKPFYTVEFLEGAVFEITAAEDIVTPEGTVRFKEGEVVDEITTSKNGKAESIPLYLGKYSVRETKAPLGMVVNSEPQIVELTYAGEETEITEIECGFFNERQKLKISLKKELERDFGLGEKEITNVFFAMYADEEITAADGNFVPKDGLMEIAGCDKDGNITFKTDLPIGSKVYVREYATDNHYILSDKLYPVEFKYEGQLIKEAKINLNDGKAIENKLLRGKITGKKTDEDGNALKGATFGLFRKGETEFKKEKAILTSVSDGDGIFSFENIPIGIWLVKELETVDGYLLNDNVFEAEIDKGNLEVTVVVINKKIPKTPDVTDLPKTGDNTKLWVPLLVMFISGFLIVGLSIKLKRRKDN